MMLSRVVLTGFICLFNVGCWQQVSVGEDSGEQYLCGGGECATGGDSALLSSDSSVNVSTDGDDTVSAIAADTAPTEVEESTAESTDYAPVDTGTGTMDSNASARFWTFDSDLEGWDIVWTEPESDTDFTVESSAITIEHSADDGDPDVGAIKIAANMGGPDYKIQTATNVDGIDLTGRIVRVKIKLAEGLTDDLENPGGAMVFAKTCDDWLWVDGGWTNITVEEGWKEIILEADYPSYVDEGSEDTDGNYPEYDASNICEIGVHFATGSSELGDGFSYLPAVVYIDSISY